MKVTDETTLGQLEIELARLGVSSVHVGIVGGAGAGRVVIYGRHAISHLKPDAKPADGILSVAGESFADAFDRFREKVESSLAARIRASIPDAGAAVD